MGMKLILTTIHARLDALELAALGHRRERLSKSQLAKIEGVTPRTIDRRVKSGILPPSDDVISGHHYWWSDSIERHQRQRAEVDTAAARAARNPRLRDKSRFTSASKPPKPKPAHSTEAP